MVTQTSKIRGNKRRVLHRVSYFQQEARLGTCIKRRVSSCRLGFETLSVHLLLAFSTHTISAEQAHACCRRGVLRPQENAPSWDPTVGLCLWPYDDPREVGVCYGRGTPVGPWDLARRCVGSKLTASASKGYPAARPLARKDRGADTLPGAFFYFRRIKLSHYASGVRFALKLMPRYMQQVRLHHWRCGYGRIQGSCIYI